MLNLTKVRHFGPTPLWSRTQIHKSTYQNRVSSNLGKLLVGIEPNISRSTAHPKPPTTGRHPDRSTFSVPWLSLSFICSFLIGLNTPPPQTKNLTLTWGGGSHPMIRLIWALIFTFKLKNHMTFIIGYLEIIMLAY